MNALTQRPDTELIIGMSNADYHAHASLSSSAIKVFNRSPLHYWQAYLNPAREVKESSKSMNLGSLVHTLFLEPEQYDAEYAITPDGIDKRTKLGKAEFAGFEEANADKCIITSEQLLVAKSMVQALEAHPVTNVLDQYSGIVEASIFYADPTTGVECRVRPDWCLPPCDAFPNGLIIDLKTTDDARPAAFARTCANFGYDISAAMYVDGFQLHYGTYEAPDFLFLVIERDAPFAVACYQASHDMLVNGRDKLNRSLSEFAKCQSVDIWHGYPALINPIDLPAWANK